LNFLRRRILTYIGVFIVTVQLIFIIPRLAPGNAASVLAGENHFAPQETALLIQRFGLNLPITTQYVVYLKDLFLTWPPFLGLSYQYFPVPVTALIATRVAWTALLIGSGFAVATALSYVLVMIGSRKRGGKFELASLYSAITLHSIPLYWTAMVLLWVFAATLKWFPIGGNVAFTTNSTLDYIGSVLWHAVLPVVAMGISILGENFLLLRGSTQEVLKADYVQAAKSRGLGGTIVASRYVLRNSLLPFVSILSFSLASLISRVVIVEAIFNYPGIGDLIVDAVVNKDYPVLQGTFFFLIIIIILGGFIGDMILVRLDPRLR
jgi:peptide/nickel transport system permease protein